VNRKILNEPLPGYPGEAEGGEMKRQTWCSSLVLRLDLLLEELPTRIAVGFGIIALAVLATIAPGYIPDPWNNHGICGNSAQHASRNEDHASLPRCLQMRAARVYSNPNLRSETIGQFLATGADLC
jgi:hypothetical protein